jgi:DNA recombination protein RmuC
MTLRTIASIWRYELQAQNAQEIGRLAGALCDKVSDSLVDFNNTTEKIGGALAAHNEAMKRLTSGKGNVLGIGERIRNLGVKTKKPIPAVLVDGQRIAASAQSDETEADDE